MSPRVRQVLKGILLFGTSGGLLYWVLSRVDVYEVGRIFAAADPLLVFVATVFSLASFALMPSIRWRATLSSMGYTIPFSKIVFARFGGQPFKFTIPLKGGEAFRAVYVRRRFGVPITTALASILWDLFLVAVGQFSFLVIGLAWAGDEVQRAVLPTIGLFGIGLILSSRHVQELGVRIAELLSEKLAEKARQLAHGFLRFPLPVKLRLVGLSLLVELTEIISFFLCAKALGLDIPLWAVLAYMPIVMVVTLVPITVRGIGTREVAVLFLFAGLAGEAELAAAALLFTFLEFILPALVGCVTLSPFLNALALEPVDESPRPEPDHTPGPFWRFLAANKRYWLLPAVLVLAAFVVMLLLTDTGDLAPFVY